MAHRALIFVALLLVLAAPAAAQVPRTAPSVDGAVTALLAEGDTLYVGGSFTAAGTAAGPLALATPDGSVEQTFPGFSAAGRLEVRALLGDRAGGWYAGGAFERVDGWERGGLVRLLADGSVDTGFQGEFGAVEALARHGDRLWVGGERLAAVDATTGAPLTVADGPVHDLAVAGDRLYVAGPAGLTARDATTGEHVAWESPIAGEIRDLDVSDGVLYAAGAAGAVALRGHGVTRYTAEPARAIAAGDGVVVVRTSRLAAFDAVTGVDRGWLGGAADGALAIDGTRLYVAGDGFASYDLRDGSPVPWSPGLLGGTVHALAAANGVVAIAGTPGVLDGVARENLAAFDLRTGAVKPFAPRVPGPVAALHASGGALYAGGAGGLAALDPLTGARLPFPEASAPVHALASSGDTLYVGGAPGTLGGVPTDGLGAVSLATKAVLPFAPALGCEVDALAVSGSTLHAGGCFGLRSFRDFAPTLGPSVDGRVLALQQDDAGGVWAAGRFAGGNVAHFAADGTRLVDAPVTDGPVHALAVAGGTVHLGGSFTRVQDAPRVNVTQVALIGGFVRAFNPRPAGAVLALAPLPDDGLALGGAFAATWDATTGGLAVFGDPPATKVRPVTRPTRPKSQRPT